MNKNILIAVIVGILFLVAVVQGVQINNINDDLEDSGIKESTVKAATTKTTQVVSQPSNVPSMVGGC